MTKDHEVIDRNGKRVHRDVLLDGDTLVVRRMMMDATDPGLAAAAALADAVKRNEKFDYAMQGHRPGYATQGRDAAASQAAEDARGKYIGLQRDAWKNPPAATVVDGATTPVEKVAIVGPTASNETLFAARDKVIADRDKRTSERWRG